MKLFWRVIGAQEEQVLLNSDKVEELDLPNEAIVDIQSLLRESAAMLPPSARTFKDWQVGLLDRYQGSSQ